MINYVCALRNREAGGGMKAELFYTDPAEAEKFAAHHNGAGVGIYDCIGLLRQGAHNRCKEEVAALDRLIVDLDLKDMVEGRDSVLAVLHSLALTRGPTTPPTARRRPHD